MLYWLHWLNCNVAMWVSHSVTDIPMYNAAIATINVQIVNNFLGSVKVLEIVWDGGLVWSLRMLVPHVNFLSSRMIRLLFYFGLIQSNSSWLGGVGKYWTNLYIQSCWLQIAMTFRILEFVKLVHYLESHLNFKNSILTFMQNLKTAACKI